MSRFLSRDSVDFLVSAESESTSEDSEDVTPEGPDDDASEDRHGAASEDPHGESEAGPNTEPDRNSWLGYALGVVIVGTVVLGLLRPFYPTTAALALGAFLALFGVFVGLLAFRERGRES
jgi:hypothetical protein